MERLKQYRQAIDNLDAEIMALLAERQMVARKIGEVKKETGLEVTDREREAAVLHARAELATALGLDTERVQKIWRLIMAEAREAQE